MFLFCNYFKMKTCFKCKKPSTVNLSHMIYCDNHFLEVIMKRIRKNQLGAFKFDKTYKILKMPTTELAIELLNKIYKGRLKLKQTTKIDENTIIPTILEQETEEFLSIFLNNKEFNTKIGIFPLRVVLNSEMEHVARILKIKYAPSKGLLDDIEKEHPGTKFALLKSLKAFEDKNL